jgi:hypothetical protein
MPPSISGSHGAAVNLQSYPSQNTFLLDPSAVLTGQPGVYGDNTQSWTVSNAGTVQSAATGIDLKSGSTVGNTALISGGADGVYIKGTGSVVN